MSNTQLPTCARTCTWAHWRRVLTTVLGLGLAGCTSELVVPPEAAIRCSSDAECPEGYECQVGGEYCVPAGQLDAKAPMLLSATAVSALRIDLAFDEPMDATSLNDLSAYELTPSLTLLQASTASEQTVTLLSEPQVPGASYTLTVSGARDRGGNELASGSIGFIGFGVPPDDAAPTQLAPVGGVRMHVTPLSPSVLVWSARRGATSYTVQVALDSAFAQQVVEATVSETSLQLPNADRGLPALESARTYYWRVRADTTLAPFDASYPQAAFEVVLDTLYVYCAALGDCSDEGQIGNLSRPLRTINGALAAASALGITRVEVAARGENAAYEEAVFIARPVSVFGGFDADFSHRDIAAHPAEIVSGSQAVVFVDSVSAGHVELDGFHLHGAEGTLSEAYGLLVSSSSDVAIRNCTITAANAAFRSVGVQIVGSGDPTTVGSGPTLEDDTITGSTAGVYGGGRSLAVEVARSGASISHCTLGGGAVSAAGAGLQQFVSGGVNLSESAVLLEGNTISSADVSESCSAMPCGTMSTRGVELYSKEYGTYTVVNNVVILGNVLNASDGSRAQIHGISSYGVAVGPIVVSNNTLLMRLGGPWDTEYAGIVESAPAAISNNLIAIEDAVSWGGSDVYAVVGDVLPASLHNNVFAGALADPEINTPSRLYPYMVEDVAAELTALGSNRAGGNQEPAFASLAFANLAQNNLHLTAATPASIRGGGKNTNASTCGATGVSSCGGVTVDREKRTRTCPGGAPPSCYSIGAFELD